MRPAAVGFAAGSDVQAIGDGDFLFSEEVESPMIYVNAEVGDTISIVLVTLSGVACALIQNVKYNVGSLNVTQASDGVVFDVNATIEKVGLIGLEFFEIWGAMMGMGCCAVAVTVNDVFCGRILAFNSSHTVADAKAIPLPVHLNGTTERENGDLITYSSYVHCEESTPESPLAWFDFAGSIASNLLKAAHIEIFMFNAEASMLSITAEGGPDVYINKRRYGLVVDVEPDGDVPFALSNSKLFGTDPAWWCQLTEI